MMMDGNNFKTPLPIQDTFWNWSFEEWRVNGQHLGAGSSLDDLYVRFHNGDDNIVVTPQHLRLLLYPLQKQALSLMSVLVEQRELKPQQTDSNTKQLEACQLRLLRWYDLAQRQSSSYIEEDAPVMQANEVMYHLISLNTTTRFKDVEALARGEMSLTDYMHTFCIRRRFWAEGRKIVYHCAQVLRLYRIIPAAHRPLWLPLAVYRAALTLWATTIVNGHQSYAVLNTVLAPGEQSFPIDHLNPSVEENHIFEQSWHRKQGEQYGVPQLYSRESSRWISFEESASSDILVHFTEALHHFGDHSALSRSITRELDLMVQRVSIPWQMPFMDHTAL